jgi:hypothetical protein
MKNNVCFRWKLTQLESWGFKTEVLRITLATKTSFEAGQRTVARKNLRVRRFGVQFLTLELSRFSALRSPWGVRGADRRLSPLLRTVKRFCWKGSKCVADIRNMVLKDSRSKSELEFTRNFAQSRAKFSNTVTDKPHSGLVRDSILE